MKIFFCSAHYILRDDLGSEFYRAVMTIKLLSKKHKVFAFCNDSNIKGNKNLKIIKLKLFEPKNPFQDLLSRFLFYFILPLKVLGLLIKQKPDVIHHMAPIHSAFFNFLFIFRFMFSNRLKFVIGPFVLKQKEKKQDFSSWLGREKVSNLLVILSNILTSFRFLTNFTIQSADHLIFCYFFIHLFV